MYARASAYKNDTFNIFFKFYVKEANENTDRLKALREDFVDSRM